MSAVVQSPPPAVSRAAAAGGAPAPGTEGPRTPPKPEASSASTGRGRSLALLLLATLLFALGPALIKSLMNVAGRLGIEGSSPLSYCNVLFVGNLAAGLVTLLLSGPPRIVRELNGLPGSAKRDLVFAAIVSVIHPALLYTALEQTSVINIVLLSRFNGIVYLAAGLLFLGTMARRSEVVGYAVIATGVIVLLFVNNMGFQIRQGDWLVLLATVSFTLTEIISRRVLRHTSIQAYVFFRNFVSALLFFAAGLHFFGPHHFAEAFDGELWVLMVLYAGVAIVAAQVAWLTASRVLSVKIVVDSQLLNPVFSIAFAYLLLREVPTPSQAVVMLIIAVGMLIPRLFRGRRNMSRARAIGIDTSLVGM